MKWYKLTDFLTSVARFNQENIHDAVFSEPDPICCPLVSTINHIVYIFLKSHSISFVVLPTPLIQKTYCNINCDSHIHPLYLSWWDETTVKSEYYTFSETKIHCYFNSTPLCFWIDAMGNECSVYAGNILVWRAGTFKSLPPR